MNINIELKVLDKRFKDGVWPLPSYQSIGAAALDLVAAIPEPVALHPGEQLVIPTGIAIHIANPDYMGVIAPRSGLGTKGLVLGNTIGVIDSDYTGEIKVVMWYRQPTAMPLLGILMPTLLDPIIIKPGDRIAQMYFQEVTRAEFHVVNSFSNVSARGESGFGSTGVGA